MCDALNRIRGPFNVNGAAIEAGVAAIRDTAHVERAVAHNDRWLDWLTAELRALGLAVTPSAGNIQQQHLPPHPGRNAAAAEDFLCGRGLILRGGGAYGLPDALRLTVGSEEANRPVVEALREFTGAARG